MVALDTNVLVRLVLNDDPTQTARARGLVLTTLCFVPLTVLLETEWVLRRVYRHSNSEIIAIFERFADMENVEIERFEAVEKAINLCKNGADFADALHLACSRDCQWLATFDQTFVRAVKGSLPPVRHP